MVSLNVSLCASAHIDRAQALTPRPTRYLRADEDMGNCLGMRCRKIAAATRGREQSVGRTWQRTMSMSRWSYAGLIAALIYRHWARRRGQLPLWVISGPWMRGGGVSAYPLRADMLSVDIDVCKVPKGHRLIYSVVFPSKCSLSASASALVACTTPSRWFGGA